MHVEEPSQTSQSTSNGFCGLRNTLPPVGLPNFNGRSPACSAPFANAPPHLRSRTRQSIGFSTPHAFHGTLVAATLPNLGYLKESPLDPEKACIRDGNMPFPLLYAYPARAGSTGVRWRRLCRVNQGLEVLRRIPPFRLHGTHVPWGSFFVDLPHSLQGHTDLARRPFLVVAAVAGTSAAGISPPVLVPIDVSHRGSFRALRGPVQQAA